MDIEQIEAFLAKTLPALAGEEFAPTDEILLAVQVQLLLHLHKKLEDIEDALKRMQVEVSPLTGEVVGNIY